MFSNAMREIRKIRDENSIKHLSMSREQRTNELSKSVDWFLSAVGKKSGIIDYSVKK